MKKHWKSYSTIAIIIILSIIATVIVSHLLQGRTITTTTNSINPAKHNSISCKADNISYPIFTYDNAQTKTLNIDLIFTGDALKTIALDYTLYYSNENMTKTSEAQNHAAMNLSFYSNGFDSDEFNAKYTKTDDSLRMNLYTQGTNIDQVSAKYFLININENGNIPKTISEYEENYIKQGLICKNN